MFELGRRFFLNIPGRALRTVAARQWQACGFLDAEVDRALPRCDGAAGR
jgi:hypothetical protein